MIAALLAFFYITFISQAYGSMLFSLFTKVTHSQSPFPQSFITTCFSGLATIGVLFTFLSLLIPMGNVTAHLLLLTPSLYWYYKKRRNFFLILTSLREKLNHYPISVFVLLSSSILLVLIMHAWFINHPDTLTYHAQNIQWIEKYRAIPGIVNLHTNYGFQSSWFILCALFSFTFTGIPALTFINATVLIWLIIFIAQKINPYLQKEKEKNILLGFLWLILLIVCFASYTQVRLTATSASPDFIVALYSWLIIYLFINFQSNRSSSHYILLISLSFFAVTIKLSALPLLLLTVYAYYKYCRYKSFLQLILPVITGFIILSPFLARNVISSGYLLFPSPFPDIFPVDWKTSKDALTLTQQYITAYARTNADYNPEEIKAVIKMKPGDWLPGWWNLRSLVDKIIVASVPLLSIVIILFKRKKIRKQSSYVLSSLFFLLIGILFWFIKAPDPRFGFGFLLPTTGIFFYILIGNTGRTLPINRRWLSYSLVFFSIIIATYSTYRLTNYFTAKNIFLPSGEVDIPYQTIVCKGVTINVPLKNSVCGNIPVPCAKDGCIDFILRGKNIQDGFKAK